MHRSSSFNQSHYHKCFKDFHTMFHKSRLWWHPNLDFMHSHCLVGHFWSVCLSPQCTKSTSHACTGWVVISRGFIILSDRYQPFPMGVNMCGFVLSDSRHILVSQWALLRWHFRASSVGGIFSKLLVLRNYEQRTSWMDVICPDFSLLHTQSLMEWSWYTSLANPRVLQLLMI